MCIRDRVGPEPPPLADEGQVPDIPLQDEDGYRAPAVNELHLAALPVLEDQGVLKCLEDTKTRVWRRREDHADEGTVIRVVADREHLWYEYGKSARVEYVDFDQQEPEVLRYHCQASVSYTHLTLPTKRIV